MTLSDLASLGSFVSGMAVYVTLIFLLVQTRQTNRNQRALMQQGRATSQVDLLLRNSEPQFARVSLRVYAGDSKVSDEDIYTWIYLCLANWRSFEDGYLQYRAGTLDEQSFRSDAAIIEWLLTYPSERATWRLVSERFAPLFRDYVDGVMKGKKAEQPPSESELWRRYVAEEATVLNQSLQGTMRN